MNDEDTLTAVRDRLTTARATLDDVRMDQPASAVLRRARARRLRRGLAGGAAGGAALGTALALGLGLGAAPGAGGTPAAGGGPGAAPGVHVNLDAWSVNTAANGTVEVTIKQLDNPAALRASLRNAGIPAVVGFGQYCRAARSSGNPLTRVIVPEKGTSSGEAVFGIDPRAMPDGTELSIGVFHRPVGGNLLTVFGLYPAGARLSCSDRLSIAPAGPGNSVRTRPGAAKTGKGNTIRLRDGDGGVGHAAG
jgi:hypothetical protein